MQGPSALAAAFADAPALHAFRDACAGARLPLSPPGATLPSRCYLSQARAAAAAARWRAGGPCRPVPQKTSLGFPPLTPAPQAPDWEPNLERFPEHDARCAEAARGGQGARCARPASSRPLKTPERLLSAGRTRRGG